MLFNKEDKIEFIQAVCPKCGGRLELDSSFEIAYCKDCGITVLIKNAKRNEKSKFDKVINVIERQQELSRQDELERKREEKEELKQLKCKETDSHWWISIIVGVFLYISGIVLLILALVFS